MKYKFHYDAGHGWLAVKFSDLKELGIETQISAYSYMGDKEYNDNTIIYLEEDCDYGVFFSAYRGKHGEDLKEESLYDGNSSRIRNYFSYTCEKNIYAERA